MSREQLTFTTLGGETITVPSRGKHYVEPRGYRHSPGTGPTGETCGSCMHRAPFGRWNKCYLNKPRWTNSRATDILTRSPACKYWEAE